LTLATEESQEGGERRGGCGVEHLAAPQGCWPGARSSRKEVIQAHLPVHLPCYDFVPVTNPTFGSALLAVRLLTSGVADSHDVTGGVYNPRERIHRTVADARLLATPTSCRRVAACNLNCGQLYGLAPLRSFATYCTGHCSVCVAPDIKAMLT
jgi:hypothetical protein